MCEQIKTIKQCYKALEYEIDKKEALRTISTLHWQLKFKDNDDFSDRFIQTAILIENNLSVFKAASDHVDIVTTILDYLYTVSVKVMFGNKLCTVNDMSITYLMFIICQDLEIPTFLRVALVDYSRLATESQNYQKLILNYVFDIIILEDADLYAIINYLKIRPFFLFKIKRIFIQEVTNEKFLSLLKKNFEYLYTFLNRSIYTFRTKKELSLISSFYACKNLYMTSIWSENITNAKILASTLHRDITFINTHFEFCSGIKFSCKWMYSSFDIYQYDLCNHRNEDGEDQISPNKCTGSIYNLFYDGIWQEPIKGTYWTHNSNLYACATREDMLKCINSAKSAYKDWSDLHIDSRRKILQNLAATLECNGKFILASTVKKWIKLSYVSSVLKYSEERLEMTCFYGPKGLVCIYDENEILLFGYLTLSLIMGNSVIVLCNQKSCTIASYFNMFSTAEIPRGIINLLSRREMCKCFSNVLKEDNPFENYTSRNYIILPLK